MSEWKEEGRRGRFFSNFPLKEIHFSMNSLLFFSMYFSIFYFFLLFFKDIDIADVNCCCYSFSTIPSGHAFWSSVWSTFKTGNRACSVLIFYVTIKFWARLLCANTVLNDFLKIYMELICITRTLSSLSSLFLLTRSMHHV